MIPKGMGDMGNLLRQAQKVQQQVMKRQEELATREVNAKAGGGMVEAVVNGRGEILRLRLEAEVVDPNDAEMLCDLIVGAVGEAQRRAQQMMQEEMGKVTGGINLPGLF